VVAEFAQSSQYYSVAADDLKEDYVRFGDGSEARCCNPMNLLTACHDLSSPSRESDQVRSIEPSSQHNLKSNRINNKNNTLKIFF